MRILIIFTTSIQKDNDKYIISNGSDTFRATYIINACAEGINEIGKLLNEDEIPLTFTKGEYILLDKDELGLVSRPIFPLPTSKGKGILASITVSGNTFFGPTAIDVDHYDTSVSYNSLNLIKTNILKMIDNVNFKKTIRLYAGVRVKHGKDFLIKFDNKNENYIVLAGISSPGLSCAPAIAEYVLDYLIKNGLETKEINFKKRKPYTNVLALSDEELSKLIEKDKYYGEIVCNCEKITKGEILEVRVSTGGRQRYWKTRIKYKFDDRDWVESETNSYLYSADGECLS